MFDWTWVLLAGELGITYGFYRWRNSYEKALTALEVAPDIDIDDIQKFSSSRNTIDYAVVHGLVRTKDSKPASILNSQYFPNTQGVIHELIVRERKFEKIRNTWAETHKTLSDVVRHVPFLLTSPSGKQIRVPEPLKFNSICDHLQVTHVKFEPNNSSAVSKLVDTFIGELTTGIETTEKMLLIDTPITGIGTLQKGKTGHWYLVPHKTLGGLLTRSSRAELISEYRSTSSGIRIFMIIFGFAAIGTAAYLSYKYYFKHQRRTSRSTLNEQTVIDNNVNARVLCVICSENEVVYSLQPCSHLGLCHTCSQTLQSRSNGEQLCPLCRAPIREYQRIFLP